MASPMAQLGKSVLIVTAFPKDSKIGCACWTRFWICSSMQGAVQASRHKKDVETRYAFRLHSAFNSEIQWETIGQQNFYQLWSVIYSHWMRSKARSSDWWNQRHSPGIPWPVGQTVWEETWNPDRTIWTYHICMCGLYHALQSFSFLC